MQTCYKIFPRYEDEEERQECKVRSNNEEYQGKKMLKVFAGKVEEETPREEPPWER